MQCLSRMCTLQLLRRIMIFTGHGRCVRVHNEIQCMKCVRNVPGLVGLKKKKKNSTRGNKLCFAHVFLSFFCYCCCVAAAHTRCWACRAGENVVWCAHPLACMNAHVAALWKPRRYHLQTPCKDQVCPFTSQFLYSAYYLHIGKEKSKSLLTAWPPSRSRLLVCNMIRPAGAAQSWPVTCGSVVELVAHDRKENCCFWALSVCADLSRLLL